MNSEYETVVSVAVARCSIVHMGGCYGRMPFRLDFSVKAEICIFSGAVLRGCSERAQNALLSKSAPGAPVWGLATHTYLLDTLAQGYAFVGVRVMLG